MLKRIRQTGTAALVLLCAAAGAHAATQAEAETALRNATNRAAVLQTLIGNTSAEALAGALANTGATVAEVVAALNTAGATAEQIANVAAAYISNLPVGQQAAAAQQLQTAVAALPAAVANNVRTALLTIATQQVAANRGNQGNQGNPRPGEGDRPGPPGQTGLNPGQSGGQAGPPGQTGANPGFGNGGGGGGGGGGGSPG